MTGNAGGVVPDFLCAFAFYHSCQGSGGKVYQRLHVKSISSAGQLTEPPCIQPDELLIKQLALLLKRNKLKGSRQAASTVPLVMPVLLATIC